MNEEHITSEWALFHNVSEIMEVRSWGYEGPYLCFRGPLKMPAEEASRSITLKIKEYGLVPFLQSDAGGVVLKFVPARKEKHKTRPGLHIALFLITVVTTLFAWVWINDNSLKDIIAHPGVLAKGIPFSFTLLVILGLHELSHYAVSKKYGLTVSLPYFIPFPNILGTMGAIIVSRSPFHDRKSLFDVGIAGPLASFFLSIIALIVGLQSSEIIRPVITSKTFLIGGSLLYNFICRLHFPNIPYGYTYSITPMMFAGWVGIFVTALNLIPMGQLDGGHISYALFGRRHGLITKVAMVVLLLIGIYYRSHLWIIIVLLITLLGHRHMPPLNDITPLNPGRIVLAGFAFLILVLCFIPVPIVMIP